MRDQRKIFRPRRRRQRIPWRLWAAVLAFLIVVGGAVGLYASVVVPLIRTSPSPTTSPTPPSPTPPCVTFGLPAASQLGSLAYVKGDVLHVLDLSACSDRVLAKTGVTSPVRFSADGRFVAFGNGTVVPSAGGAPIHPLGEPVVDWAWAPAGGTLAGVTRDGRVLLGSPGTPARTIVSGADPAGGLAFSPDGTSLAVNLHEDSVDIASVAGAGSPRSIFQVPRGQFSPPVIAGWSPDGHWVLFWPRRKGAKAAGGLELRAAPAGSGNWVQVLPAMLPEPDFVAPCGSGLALVDGSGRVVTKGKQVVMTAPPRWRFDNVTHDYVRSWMDPACSPDGRWLAAEASNNVRETFPGTTPRSLWVIATDHSGRARLTPVVSEAFEFPRWASDGDVLMYIRRNLQADAPGLVFLVAIDPKTGKPIRTVGPLANIGPAPQSFGLFAWAERTDWHR